jgi:hypothetical protein
LRKPRLSVCVVAPQVHPRPPAVARLRAAAHEVQRHVSVQRRDLTWRARAQARGGRGVRRGTGENAACELRATGVRVCTGGRVRGRARTAVEVEGAHHRPGGAAGGDEGVVARARRRRRRRGGRCEAAAHGAPRAAPQRARRRRRVRCGAAARCALRRRRSGRRLHGVVVLRRQQCFAKAVAVHCGSGERSRGVRRRARARARAQAATTRRRRTHAGAPTRRAAPKARSHAAVPSHTHSTQRRGTEGRALC